MFAFEFTMGSADSGEAWDGEEVISGEAVSASGIESDGAFVKAKDGQVLCKKEVGANFESSPCVVGNTAVVGCRGTNIYKFVIK